MYDTNCLQMRHFSAYSYNFMWRQIIANERMYIIWQVISFLRFLLVLLKHVSGNGLWSIMIIFLNVRFFTTNPDVSDPTKNPFLWDDKKKIKMHLFVLPGIIVWSKIYKTTLTLNLMKDHLYYYAFDEIWTN